MSVLVFISFSPYCSYTYLLILQVTVLALNGMQLIAKSEEVLVSLLNLENLSLQLGDQKILLVRGEVHAIVVL